MGGKYSIWTTLLVAALCPPVLAAEPSTTILLRTAAQEGTEPKFIAAGKDRIGGLCIDIMRAIEQADPGLRFAGDQRWKPLIRAYSELESGLEDVQCAVQRTAEREKRFNFIGPALYTIDYHFLARANDLLTIHTWDDVRKLKPDKLYFATSKQLDPRVGERLAAVLHQLEKTGELARLMRKWD